MPAESIKVSPPELLASAYTSARVLEKAAAPAVDGVPKSAGGASAADLAGSAVAAGIGVLEQGFLATNAWVGSAVESTTREGVAMLQREDEVNDEALRAVVRPAEVRRL